MPAFAPRTLGRSQLTVSALGIGASYGAPAAAIEDAFHRGVNYLYWGSLRRDPFAEALRNLRPHRDRIVLVIQSFSRSAALLQRSLENALRTIGHDRAAVLLLGYWNRPIPERILDAARELRHRGLAAHLAASSHNRPTLAHMATLKDLEILPLRYSALHRGAEHEVFPHLPPDPPGVVTYTATHWGRLLNPAKLPAGEPTPTAAHCYRFALSHPAVHVCLTGPSSADECRHALTALEAGPLHPDELAWMRRLARE